MLHSKSTDSRKKIKAKVLAATAGVLFASLSSASCQSPPPVILTFAAVPTEITAGESSTLRWQVKGATTVSIDHGIGEVSPTGTTTVSPQKTIAYTLTASNKGGTVTRSVVIYVSPATSVEVKDTIPPVIKDISSSLQNEATAVISWTTSEPTTGKVEYGRSTQYGFTATSEGLKTAHSVTLYSLDPNAIYHFRIVAKDEVGNESISPDNVFTTPPPKSGFSLELLSLEWGRKWEFEGESYGEGFGKRLIYVRGTAQNTSNATLRSIICTMHCWSGGRLVKSELYVYRAPILPGYVFKFDINTLDDPSVDNVTVEFADDKGRQIKFVQR